MLASFVACARATLALGKMDCLVRQAGYYFPPIQATAFLFLKRINANNLYMEWGFTFHPYFPVFLDFFPERWRPKTKLRSLSDQINQNSNMLIKRVS